ncbi:MCE family protein [Nocardia alni]|uniref:MCE family protein n=1 Tax=Nocardia alni TaxID=2815723 RepID=UPI001C23FAC5|nr:MCE family protein [Nocardia alni]
MDLSELRRVVPRRKTLEDYSKAWLGFGALGLLVLAIVVALAVHSLNFGQRRVEADFAQAAQLGNGDQVTVAGVPVGHVAGLRLAGDHIAVTLSIDHSVRLGSGTGAAIKLTTMLGNRYVELTPAGAGELPGGRIGLAHTQVPYDLESALQDVTTTFDQVDADQVGHALTDLSSQLSGLPGLLPAAMQNIKTLSAVIAERRDQLGALLNSTSQLTDLIQGQRANLGALFTQGSNLLQEIVTRQRAIESMLTATTTLVHTLTPIVVNDQPELQQLLGNLNAMTGMLSRHDDLLRNILQILPVPWRTWANFTGAGTELDANAPDGAFIDSFMCALVGRAPQVNLPPYSKDCR